MAEWKDITSYSQSDTERVPRTWEARPGGIELVVTRYHGCDGWLMLCREYGVESHRGLNGDTIDEAKIDALVRLMAMAARAQSRAFVAHKEALDLISA